MSATVSTYGDIGVRVGIYAVAKMLARVEPITVLEKFAHVEPMPKNKGEVIKWRRIRPLAVSTTGLTEGVTPPPSQISYDTVATNLAQFGGWVQLSDKVTDLHEDKVLDDAMTALADVAANTKELILWGVLRGGTAVLYTNGAARTSVNTPIDLDIIRAGVNTLKKNHAKKITGRLAAGPNIGTEPVAPSFVIFASVDMERDFREMDTFVPLEKYGQVKPLDEDNELGKIEECRIILSPQLIPFPDAGGSVTGTGMRSTTGTLCDVYPIIIIAKDAYGTVPLKGKDVIEMAVTNAKMGAVGDPLGQRSFVSWKMWYQAVRLNEQWMIRIEAAATQLS